MLLKPNKDWGWNISCLDLSVPFVSFVEEIKWFCVRCPWIKERVCERKLKEGEEWIYILFFDKIIGMLKNVKPQLGRRRLCITIVVTTTRAWLNILGIATKLFMFTSNFLRPVNFYSSRLVVYSINVLYTCNYKINSIQRRELSFIMKNMKY